jgi:hypothetical protein
VSIKKKKNLRELETGGWIKLAKPCVHVWIFGNCDETFLFGMK